MQTGETDIVLFMINMIVSSFGGMLGLYIAKTVKNKIDQKASEKIENH